MSSSWLSLDVSVDPEGAVVLLVIIDAMVGRYLLMEDQRPGVDGHQTSDLTAYTPGNTSLISHLQYSHDTSSFSYFSLPLSYQQSCTTNSETELHHLHHWNWKTGWRWSVLVRRWRRLSAYRVDVGTLFPFWERL